MISAKHVNEELPVIKEGEEATLTNVYNALRVNAKLLLNIRTNQVVIGDRMGVDFKKASPSAEASE